MNYGLVGAKLGYSFSPEIHNKISGIEYGLFEMTKEELYDFLSKKEFKGLNITIPYKETVVPVLSEIFGEAKELQVVNTVVNNDGKLYGYNTDCTGVKLLILNSGIEISGKKVLILGTGATSNTLYYVLNELGASEIIKVSRSAKEGCIDYEQAVSEYTDADVIVNTTPVGTFPNVNSAPIDLSCFSKLSGVVDVIYNPLKTALVRQAESLGVKAVNGLYMLVAQAVCSNLLFTGKISHGETDFLSCPEVKSISDRIYKSMLQSKTNIVLTGMPSSGKSTLGKHLASITGLEHIDTDKVITTRTGMSIPQIFEQYGEKHFRELETEVIKEFSLKTGLIISTGGGSILNPENILALRANGRIFFIDRPLSMLVSTKSRPLSSDADALKKRYEERYPIYRSTCDERLNGRLTVKEEASNVIRLLKEYVANTL